MNLLETPAAGEYRVIYADPPWKFVTRSAKGRESAKYRGPEKHYPTLTLDEIRALPVPDVAGRDCHLFLWTTGPFLEASLELLRRWGFRYSTVGFVWVKLRRGAGGGLFYDCVRDFHIGTGYTTRANAEFCLLGRRGRPSRLSAGVRQLIVDPVREHSRKPEETRDRIIRYAEGPRLEMFARSSAPGFDVWGNEVAKFDPRPVRLVAAGSGA